MTILLVDTSSRMCGAALVKNGAILAECNVLGEKNHSVNMMPMIENILAMTGVTLDAVDCFAAVTGPGSFTGVRIGVTAVKALAQAQGKPCVGVDALEALACNIEGFDGVICPVLDARAGQVYGAVFRPGEPPERECEDVAEPLTEYLERVADMHCRAMFVGEGVPAFRERIAERLGDKAVFAGPQNAILRPASCAHLAEILAMNPYEFRDCMTLLPLYLRAPQAERERAAREAKQNV